MNNILFICIGNSNIIGDSLGPLVGSFFQSYKNNLLNYYNIEIQGTMDNPVGYKKINNILENIENKEYTKIIITFLTITCIVFIFFATKLTMNCFYPHNLPPQL